MRISWCLLEAECPNQKQAIISQYLDFSDTKPTIHAPSQPESLPGTLFHALLCYDNDTVYATLRRGIIYRYVVALYSTISFSVRSGLGSHDCAISIAHPVTRFIILQHSALSFILVK